MHPTHSTPYAHGSIDIAGRLPKGDPRHWAQSLTDVIASAHDRDALHRIRDAEGRALTRADVDAARDCHETSGLRAGETVIVAVENTVDCTARLLALWMQGIVVCPVDPATAPETLALIAEVSEAQALIAQDGSLTRRDCPARAGTIRLIRPLRVTGSDMAMMIFTSGSSGTPKGVMLTHGNVMSALRAIASYQALDADDTIMAIPPFFFDYGLYQLFLALFSGAGLILGGTTRILSKMVPMIVAQQPTILPVVPALAAGIGKILKVTGQTLPSVRLLTNTGGHLPEDTIALLQEVCPNLVPMPMYGLTECKRALYCDRGAHPDASDSVGRAMPGLSARVMVETQTGGLRAAATDEVGELYVRGSSVMQGYRGAASSAGARLVEGRWRSDNWLATGDLMSCDARGLHSFRGRAKALIKQAGYCIVPRDLEKMAEALPEIGTAIVVGRTESSGDESAVMFVLPAQAGAGLDSRAIKARLAAHLPASLMPRVVALVEDWPATPNGKICLKTLTAKAKDLK